MLGGGIGRLRRRDMRGKLGKGVKEICSQDVRVAQMHV